MVLNITGKTVQYNGKTCSAQWRNNPKEWRNNHQGEYPCLMLFIQILECEATEQDFRVSWYKLQSFTFTNEREYVLLVKQVTI